MNHLANNLVQCWGCPVFDRLFQVISYAGAEIYKQMAEWAWITLAGFWVFYVVWIVWTTMKDEKSEDWMYQKSFKPVFINSLVVCAFLGMGIYFPKFITTLTFEPVTSATTVYAQALMQTDPSDINKRVTYQPEPMDDTGIFRPVLRDRIILLIKTTVTQFQSLINFGFAVIDKAFDWKVWVGLAVFIAANFIPFLGPVVAGAIKIAVVAVFFKNLLMLGLGLFMIIQFFKLFIEFCYRFIDVIVSLAMFAFFFPFMLAMFVVQKSSSADWVKKFSSGFSSTLIKDTFNSIVSLVGAVLVYTVIIAMVTNFFSSDLFTSNEIVKHIMDGTITGEMLDNIDLANVTLLSCCIFGFVLNYLGKQIDSVNKEIIGAFGVDPSSSIADDISKRMDGMIKNKIQFVKDKFNAARGKTKAK